MIGYVFLSMLRNMCVRPNEDNVFGYVVGVGALSANPYSIYEQFIHTNDNLFYNYILLMVPLIVSLYIFDLIQYKSKLIRS